MEQNNRRWIFIVVFLMVLFLFVSLIAGIFALFSGADEPLTGNVALIHIEGVILSDGSTSVFGEQIASASSITEKIRTANEAPNVKAILFEINSPGGSVVASEEITHAIQASNKSTVSYIREVGASGAYWAASATDHIFASRMSVTGSVGVIASYLEYSELLERYNVTYERIASGKYKDMGSPFKKLNTEERGIFEKQLDLIHDYFLQDVAKSRGLTAEQIEHIATAQVYLGVEAKAVGLIDDFGGREEAIAYIENQLNMTASVDELTDKKGFFELLSEAMNERAFFVGQGMGSYLFGRSPVQSIRIVS